VITPEPQKPAAKTKEHAPEPSHGGLTVTPILPHPDDATTEPEPSKEDLQAEYEKLFGDKPDGRWNAKKLQEKIQEKKDQ
jgi:hypothetical protein